MKFYTLFSFHQKTIARYDPSFVAAVLEDPTSEKNELLALLPPWKPVTPHSAPTQQLSCSVRLFMPHGLVLPSLRSSGTGPGFLTPRHECTGKIEHKNKPGGCQTNDGLKPFSPHEIQRCCKHPLSLLPSSGALARLCRLLITPHHHRR